MLFAIDVDFLRNITYCQMLNNRKNKGFMFIPSTILTFRTHVSVLYCSCVITPSTAHLSHSCVHMPFLLLLLPFAPAYYFGTVSHIVNLFIRGLDRTVPYQKIFGYGTVQSAT